MFMLLFTLMGFELDQSFGTNNNEVLNLIFCEG
jgi:hypothetical protein